MTLRICATVRVDSVFCKQRSKPECYFVVQLFVFLLNLYYARIINGVWNWLAVREAEALGRWGQDFGFFKLKPISFLTSTLELGIGEFTFRERRPFRKANHTQLTH
jgi:hypothetical protein